MLLLYVEEGEIKIKSVGVNLYDMGRMCVELQSFFGLLGMDMLGLDLDGVKDMLLDSYTEAVEAVEKAAANGKGGG